MARAAWFLGARSMALMQVRPVELAGFAVWRVCWRVVRSRQLLSTLLAVPCK